MDSDVYTAIERVTATSMQFTEAHKILALKYLLQKIFDTNLYNMNFANGSRLKPSAFLT